MLTKIEEDFVDFVSDRNKENRKDVLERYENTKNSIDFSSKEFRHQSETWYVALATFFNDKDEQSAIAAYQYFAYPDILRMLSYSFPKSPTAKGYLKTLLRSLRNGDLEKIYSFLRRKVENKKHLPLSDILLSQYKAPTIVDYGCGLAYLSFEMARKSRDVTVVLVDIDSVKLDFAEFRFKKYGLQYQVIRINVDNPYPTLPEHAICIATEVMEHLHQPLIAYRHIYESMMAGGTLYGDFHDHKPELFHVHPDLTDLRSHISKDYDKVGRSLYKKR